MTLHIRHSIRQVQRHINTLTHTRTHRDRYGVASPNQNERSTFLSNSLRNLLWNSWSMHILYFLICSIRSIYCRTLHAHHSTHAIHICNHHVFDFTYHNSHLSCERILVLRFLLSHSISVVFFFFIFIFALLFHYSTCTVCCIYIHLILIHFTHTHSHEPN